MKLVARIDVELEAESEAKLDRELDRILEVVNEVSTNHRYSFYQTDEGFADADLEKELTFGLYQ